MSYDVHLHIDVDTGAAEPVNMVVHDVGNYTANVSPMWTKALGYRLADLHGRTAGDVMPDVRRAAWHMANNPEIYRAMEPDNGWGSHEGARDYLAQLLEGCLAHPKASIYVSH